ncbi:MAG: hypothetical protein Q4B99_00270 [Clostridia bacterium]|nr:hypothetical protein [Clostridia bacterium]
MIVLSYELMEKSGLRYVLDMLGTCSPYGAQRKRRLRVYDRASRAELVDELYNVRRIVEYMGEHDCSGLERLLMGLKDIRRSVEALGSLALSDVELFELKRFFLQLERIAPEYAQLDEACELRGMHIASYPEALRILDPEGQRAPTFMVSSRYSERLTAIRREKRDIEERIRSADGGEREQLMLERTRIAACEDEEQANVRRGLCERLLPYARDVLLTIDSLGRLDFTLGRARLARAHGCCAPELTDARVAFEGMTHPQVAHALEQRSKAFTPIDVSVDRGVTVITGANMGGKSVALNSIALNVLCVHCGIFPFARSAAVPLFDGLHMISEDAQDASRGLSSFGAEMLQLDGAVSQLREGELALLLIDELARGTNPDEGASIVRGVVAMLRAEAAVTVLATHYDDVACLADAHYQVKGMAQADLAELRRRIQLQRTASIELIEECMDYGIARVDGNNGVPKDAVEICELLGINEKIMRSIKNFVDKRR